MKEKTKSPRKVRLSTMQIAQAVTNSVSGMDGVNLEALNQFGQAIQTFLESTLTPPASHTDEEPDQ